MHKTVGQYVPIFSLQIPIGTLAILLSELHNKQHGWMDTLAYLFDCVIGIGRHYCKATKLTNNRHPSISLQTYRLFYQYVQIDGDAKVFFVRQPSENHFRTIWVFKITTDRHLRNPTGRPKGCGPILAFNTNLSIYPGTKPLWLAISIDTHHLPRVVGPVAY